MREVLGGGSGGRYYADGEDTIHVVPDSRNLPTEFTESRFPFLVERLGPGRRLRRRRAATAAGSATRSTSGCCATRTSCRSPTARSWPAGACKGGKAGRPFQVTVDPGGPRRARGRRAGRRRAGAGRRGRPDPDDGRRRLGRPAGPPGRRGASATSRGARCRVEGARARLRRGADRRRRRRRPSTTAATDELRAGAARPAAPATSRSSTAAPATPGCPAARPTPTSTSSERPGLALAGTGLAGPLHEHPAMALEVRDPVERAASGAGLDAGQQRGAGCPGAVVVGRDVVDVHQDAVDDPRCARPGGGPVAVRPVLGRSLVRPGSAWPA